MLQCKHSTKFYSTQLCFVVYIFDLIQKFHENVTMQIHYCNELFLPLKLGYNFKILNLGITKAIFFFFFFHGRDKISTTWHVRWNCTKIYMLNV